MKQLKSNSSPDSTAQRFDSYGLDVNEIAAGVGAYGRERGNYYDRNDDDNDDDDDDDGFIVDRDRPYPRLAELMWQEECRERDNDRRADLQNYNEQKQHHSSYDASCDSASEGSSSDDGCTAVGDRPLHRDIRQGRSSNLERAPCIASPSVAQTNSIKADDTGNDNNSDTIDNQYERLPPEAISKPSEELGESWGSRMLARTASTRQEVSYRTPTEMLLHGGKENGRSAVTSKQRYLGDLDSRDMTDIKDDTEINPVSRHGSPSSNSCRNIESSLPSLPSVKTNTNNLKIVRRRKITNLDGKVNSQLVIDWAPSSAWLGGQKHSNGSIYRKKSRLG